MSLQADTGFFGKLPAYGDFIHRHLPSDVMANWDEWLKSYVGSTQERLGEQWLDVYLTSPIWRFAISTGGLSDQSWAGVLLPSVDRVGRYFPFTVLRQIPEGLSPSAIMSTQEVWYQQLEEIGLSALQGELDADQVIEQATLIPWQEVDPFMEQALPEVEAGVVVDHPCEEQGVLNSMPHMLDAFIRSAFKSHSIWSTAGSERVAPCTFTANGLPPVSGGSAMMDGLWEDWEWSVPWRLTDDL